MRATCAVEVLETCMIRGVESLERAGWRCFVAVGPLSSIPNMDCMYL